MKTLLIIVVIVGIVGTAWLLGTKRGDSNWSADRVRDNITGQKTSDEPAKEKPVKENKNQIVSVSGQVQNVNIHVGNLPEQTAEEQKKNTAPAEKKDNLKDRPDPKNPDPTRSWSNADKVKAPVDYMNAVLTYLQKKKKEVEVLRFDIGVSCKTWESKLAKAEKNARADLAVLREAVGIYKECEKQQTWPASFAYRSYTKKEFILKLNDLEKRCRASRAEASHIQNGLNRLQDTLRLQDRSMELLAARIQTYTDNLELVRSGKISGKIEDFLKSLDNSVGVQEQLLRQSQQKAEKEVFAGAAQERSEAAGNLDSILKKYSDGN